MNNAFVVARRSCAILSVERSVCRLQATALPTPQLPLHIMALQGELLCCVADVVRPAHFALK